MNRNFICTVENESNNIEKKQAGSESIQSRLAFIAPFLVPIQESRTQILSELFNS